MCIFHGIYCTIRLISLDKFRNHTDKKCLDVLHRGPWMVRRLINNTDRQNMFFKVLLTSNCCWCKQHISFCSVVCASMMTSSNGNVFRVTGHLCGEFTGPGEFPAQRPVTRSFDVFFDLRLDGRLSKQSWGWWFETQSCPIWRQCNGN